MDVLPPNPGLTAAGRAACAAWFGPVPPEVGPSPGAGFSGAPLACVRPRGGAEWFVLKAFPAGTPRGRAGWVHGFARHLAAAGVTEVPRPVSTPAGDTVVTDDDGMHWELVPFITGTATDEPSDPQAVAALETLARVHVAAATLPGVEPRVGRSPSIVKAVARGRELAERPWRRRGSPVPAADDAAFLTAVGERRERAIALVDTPAGGRAVAAVAGAGPQDVPLQAVLRDVWAAHVLFAPGVPARVAGIVDVHAATIDAPAVDLARLIGSWRRRAGRTTADPAAGWEAAIAAYTHVRPLSRAERRSVAFMAAAGTILGLEAWFRWTLEERRRFHCPDAVVSRIDWLLAALPDAIHWLAGGGASQV